MESVRRALRERELDRLFGMMKTKDVKLLWNRYELGESVGYSGEDIQEELIRRGCAEYAVLGQIAS